MTRHTEDDQSFVLEALPAFVSEAGEQLEALEALLLQLEEDPGNRELLDALFRCAHTVKGSAGIFGLNAVVAFTHHVETLLDRMREGDVALTPELSTLLLRCGDAIRHLVSAAGNPGLDQPEDVTTRDALVTQLQLHTGLNGQHGPTPPQAATQSVEHPAQESAWRLAATFGPDLFRNGMDPLAIVAYLEGMGHFSGMRCARSTVPALESMDAETCYIALESQFISPAPRTEIESAFSFVREDCQLLLEPMDTPDKSAVLAIPDKITASDPSASTAPGSATKTRHQAAGDETRYIRVQADRLDAVINLLGELVVAGAGAEMLARQTRQTGLIEANLHMARLIEEIRNGTLQLRMVPIGETFSRFRRVVRDTAAELCKDVAFEMAGGDTELDKSVVEKIADPLMHLVRNALDHGLEPAEERVAHGKPAQGTMRLSAHHEAGSILIRIEDDGRGIHRQKVLQRAWDRGLVDKGVTPTDDEILRLIFEPGFSTAEQITNLSGRGVGMDVVRSNIEALRGTVQVSSQEGLGTQISIRLPLTLAIIDGFLVGVDHSKFIFPLESVVEVIENRPTETPMDHLGRAVVELRGQVLPVLSLRQLYNIESLQPERSSVVVLRYGSHVYGVMVDQLLGQYQTVIKPLGRMFRSLRGMSGSSILGNGEVALIFDVASLAQMASAPPVSQSRVSRSPRISTTSTTTSTNLEGQSS